MMGSMIKLHPWNQLRKLWIHAQRFLCNLCQNWTLNLFKLVVLPVKLRGEVQRHAGCGQRPHELRPTLRSLPCLCISKCAGSAAHMKSPGKIQIGIPWHPKGNFAKIFFLISSRRDVRDSGRLDHGFQVPLGRL